MLKVFRTWSAVVHGNLKVVLALVIGFLIGLLFLMPLIPYSLPDSTANIVGAAVGAAIAVLGAEVVANRKDRKRRDAAAEAVEDVANRLRKNLREMRVLVEAIRAQPGRTASIRDAQKKSVEISALLIEFDRTLAFMTPLFHGMGGPGVIVFGSLKAAAESFDLACTGTHWATMYDDDDACIAQRDACLMWLSAGEQRLDNGVSTARIA